jgi:hypothetical protein
MVSAMSDDDKEATNGAADEADTLKHIGGSRSDAWNNYIGAQALASIYPYSGDEEKRDKMRDIVVAGLTGIAPRDEVEGMLAAQMLACHDTAMGCFRDALNSKLHGRLWHEYLEQAGKLTRAFAMLLDALNRHRGKGMQKITVEHVHAHSGGQAVVGILEGGGVQPRSEDQAHGSRTTAKASRLAPRPVAQPAMRSADAECDALQVSRDGERPLPVSRREGDGRAEG